MKLVIVEMIDSLETLPFHSQANLNLKKIVGFVVVVVIFLVSAWCE